MSYNTNLKNWGSTGEEYPDNYAYEEGEQPVDVWDNFFSHNVIEDIKYLIGEVNDIEETASNSVTLEDARSNDNNIQGTVDYNNNSLINVNIAANSATINNDDVAVEPWVNNNFNNYTFSESHIDLTDVNPDDHHARYEDSEARTAVDGSNVRVHGTYHADLNGVNPDDHHARYTDSEAQDALEGTSPTFKDVTSDLYTSNEAIQNAVYTSVDDVPAEHEKKGRMVYTEDEGLVVWE